MSRFGTHYQVSRPTNRCAHTGEPIEPGSAYMAALCDRSDDEGFERLDFSIAAWESGVRPEGLFSYWKSIAVDPGQRQNPLVDDAVLMEIFERLAHDERPQRVGFRFVLGLILMRKKMLKLVGRTNTDPQRWLLQPRGSDAQAEPLQLINPNLSETDIRDLTDQLSEILQGEL